MTRLIVFFILFTGCVCGAFLRENLTRLSATEGIILSGGEGAHTSVEVFVPSTGLSCSLPALPDERHSHTMDSLLICGGGDYFSTTTNTCLSLTSGQWMISRILQERRVDHTSWQTEQGLVLMGGEWSPDTSEVVATAGQEGPSFAMQSATKYACSIADLSSDSAILTGGHDTMSTVSRYGVLGWVEDLPPLVVGRWSHGCGSFIRGDGAQVLLVAGGLDSSNSYLSSTEVLTMDSPVWTLTTPLPRAVTGVRGITVGGRLFMTGGRLEYTKREEILCWLDEEQEWEETGKMKRGRYYHAVSTIQMDDQAMEHCG